MLSLLIRPFKTMWGRIALGVATVLIIAVAVLATGNGAENQTQVAVQEQATPTDTPTAMPTAIPTAVPTATTEPTPTPTPTPGPVSPLNGMPVDEPSATRLLTVKIDNHAKARPQSGIQHADMMVEIWVEGITRFLSVWQDSDTEVLGPIRSMRPTDFAIQNSWASTYVNSGGQGWVQAIGNASSARFFVQPRGTFRVSFKSAPHNLYGDTTVFRTLDDRGDYDEPLGPLWNFGKMPADAVDTLEIATNWSSNFVVGWSWNGSEYERTTTGQPHNYLDDDGDAQRITADTLVILEMTIYQRSGGSGSSVPASETVGTGTAWIFANGKMQQGTWARESELDWFTLVNQDGSLMAVPPGRLWLVLAPTGGVVPS